MNGVGSFFFLTDGNPFTLAHADPSMFYLILMNFNSHPSSFYLIYVNNTIHRTLTRNTLHMLRLRFFSNHGTTFRADNKTSFRMVKHIYTFQMNVTNDRCYEEIILFNVQFPIEWSSAKCNHVFEHGMKTSKFEMI